MKPSFVEKEGFKIRALICPSCSNKILHPTDIEEFNKFNSLKNRHFQVKLRLVGNSYTVSIPREIVNFMREEEPESIHKKMQDHMHKQMQVMEQMVTMAMEEANKIGLSFNTTNITKKTDGSVFRVLGMRSHSDINEENAGEAKRIKGIKITRIKKNEENEDDN